MTIAAVVTALASLVSAVALLVSVILNGRHIEAAHETGRETLQEVKTANAQSAAQLLDAQESRRIADIPDADRSDLERSHLHDSPVPPRGKAPRQGEGPSQ